MDIVNDHDVSALIRQDSMFGEIERLYGKPPNWRRSPGFESLCRIILEQQVSLDAANAHYRKLKGYVGNISCKNIMALSDAEFRECQISRQKMIYLRGLAAAIKNRSLRLRTIAEKSPEEIRGELTKIKGIGNWTTDIYLMFCLQSKDVFPIGDIAIRKTMSEMTGILEEEEMLERAGSWKPLRSLASYYLWHYYLSSRRKAFPFNKDVS